MGVVKVWFIKKAVVWFMVKSDLSCKQTLARIYVFSNRSWSMLTAKHGNDPY